MPNFLNQKLIKQTLKDVNIKPSKRLGQNFLISQNVLQKIIEVADIQPTDIIIEIGPGLGTLTLALAEKALRVIAIEKDRRMAETLRQILADRNIENVEVINADILEIQYSQLQTTPPSLLSYGGRSNYKLISNLPYNVATAVIMKFLTSENPPSEMVVMVQKEVGQRICASPRQNPKDEGGPKMSKLAVFCQLFSEPKLVAYVKKSAFWPQPKIDSAILQFRVCPRADPGQTLKSGSGICQTLEEIVNAGFSQPRKTLLNNLSGGLKITKGQATKWIEQTGLLPSQRPETLSVSDWLKLTSTIPNC